MYIKSALGLNVWSEQGIGHSIKKFVFTMQNSLWGTRKKNNNIGPFSGLPSLLAKRLDASDEWRHRTAVLTSLRPYLMGLGLGLVAEPWAVLALVNSGAGP